MLKTSFLALLTAWTTAHAAPQAPTPPPAPPPPTDKAPACKASGDPLLSIEHAVIAGVKQPTSVSKLYASGAWTFVETDADGKVSRSVSGCLGKDDFAKLKTALDAAPWTITHPQMHCNARTQSYTVFTAGKNTFKEMTCGNDLLDDKTHLALNDADKQIATASAPHDPPCCKK